VKVCSKDYPVPKHKSAGIKMNGFPCPVSFGLGASTMQSGESLSKVWTIILLFFPFVFTVIYDNACHLFASILIRLPLRLLGRRIVVNRVHHIKGYSCGCSFGAHGLPDLDKSYTSTLACLNKLLRRIATSVLHFWPQNFSTYVALRVVFVNMLARWRLKANKVDSEGASLSGILNGMVECKCWRCVEARCLPCRVFLRLEGDVRSQLYVGALGKNASVAAAAKAVCQERKRAGLRGLWLGGSAGPENRFKRSLAVVVLFVKDLGFIGRWRQEQTIATNPSATYIGLGVSRRPSSTNLATTLELRPAMPAKPGGSGPSGAKDIKIRHHDDDQQCL
jgi:hypothetical protein